MTLSSLLRGGLCGLALALSLAGGTAHAQTVTQAFSFTGANQSFPVPSNVSSLTVKLWGAGGGWAGGSGAFVTGLLTVTPGSTLTFIVGGGGSENGPGGFGGGGNAPPGFGGGGGRSAIRLGSTELVTAAGGGGDSRGGGGRSRHRRGTGLVPTAAVVALSWLVVQPVAVLRQAASSREAMVAALILVVLVAVVTLVVVVVTTLVVVADRRTAPTRLSLTREPAKQEVRAVYWVLPLAARATSTMWQALVGVTAIVKQVAMVASSSTTPLSLPPRPSQAHWFCFQ